MSKVKNINQMFYNCLPLIYLGDVLSRWNINKNIKLEDSCLKTSIKSSINKQQ